MYLILAEFTVAEVAIRPEAVDKADVVRVAALGTLQNELLRGEKAVILIAHLVVHDVRWQFLALIGVKLNHRFGVTRKLALLLCGAFGDLWCAASIAAARNEAALTSGGAVDSGYLMLQGIDNGC